MKTAPITCTILGGLAVLGILHCAKASPVPTSLTASLQQREQKLGSLSFLWRQQVHNHNAGMPAKELLQIKQGQEKADAAHLKQMGMEEKQIPAEVQKETRSLETALSEATWDYVAAWRFQRNGASTLVCGSEQNNSIVSEWQQLYTGDACLYAVISTRTTAGQVMEGEGPTVWQTAGESIRQDSALFDGRCCSPEQAVMLAGFSPLDLHSASWDMTTQTPSRVSLTAHYTQQYAPTTETITLDRSRGSAPTEITKTQQGLTQKWAALGFQNINGVWMASKVVYSSLAPDGTTSRQIWSLQTTHASLPIALSLPKYALVQDYRLRDGELSWQALVRGGGQFDMSVVRYPWPGHLPSRAELLKMDIAQHPGEASPDPEK